MDAMMTAKGDVWVSYHYPARIAGNLGTIVSSLTACTTGSSTTSDR